jgi:hypothetical protein
VETPAEVPLSLLEGDKQNVRDFVPGVLGSVLVHALIGFVLIYKIIVPETTSEPVIPVEVVVLGEDNAPPRQAQQQAAITGPQQQRGVVTRRNPPRSPRREPEKPAPPPAVPIPELQKPDELQTKLESLAKLRQPETGDLASDGGANRTAAGRANGSGTGYSVRDLIRAQVTRRWSLNLNELGERNIAIAVRIVLARDGTVEAVDVVDDKRTGQDRVYRSIAISVRNAVLLSSPFMLPAEAYGRVTDVTVTLNTRDVLR